MNSKRNTNPPDGGIVLAGLAAQTSRGRVRPNNQDFFHAERSPAEREVSHGHLLIVADGMGGHAAGEVASRLAVEVFREKYFRAKLTPHDNPVPVLRAALYEANRLILRRGEEDDQLRGMGTTCSAVVIRGGRFWIAHVGDSRVYRFRSGRLEQLTQDHNLAATLLAEGKIDGAEAATHRGRHILTRALGVRTSVEPDITASPLEIQPADRILLCTDGLNRGASDEQLGDLLAEEDVAAVVERMVDVANQAGGPDNITAVLAAFGVAGE